MSYDLSLKVEVGAGVRILDACNQAVRIARKLDLIVEFDFNGVLVLAKPCATPEKLAERYMVVSSSDSEYKIACVHD